MNGRIKEVGERIADLEILENLGIREYCGERTTYYKCRCLLCGSIKDIPNKNIGKSALNCGCKRKNRRKILPIGSVVNGFEIMSEPIPNPKGKGHCDMYDVKCQRCGEIYQKRSDAIRSKDGVSCGCVRNKLLSQNVKKAYESNFVNGTNVAKVNSEKLQSNNTSGHRCVNWHAGTRMWIVRVQFQKRQLINKYFSDYDEACKAADEALQERDRMLKEMGL